MPSIVPIEQTRGYAVRPARGLRFGNFEGVVHLPPVKQPSKVGLHSYATLNNQHIYRTVGDWVRTWQPWQQKILLYSIANRLTLPQLEILATTLEPLRHRDPLTASRWKPTVLSIASSAKSSASQKPHNKLPLIITPPSLSKSGHDSKTTALNANDKPTESAAKREESNMKFESKDESRNSVKSNEAKNLVENNNKRRKSVKSKEAKNSEENYETNEKPETRSQTLNLDQYASLVSSSVVAAALGEISFVNQFDNIRKIELNVESDKPASEEDGDVSSPSNHVIVKVGDMTNTSQPESSQPSSAVDKDKEQDTTQLLHPSSSSNIRPGILRSSSGKRPDRSRNTSAQFLGGRISFTPGSRHSERSEGQRSGSSRYRYSAFASSAASTPDFFYREKIGVLGPMQRTIRSGQVQRPVGLGDVPLPLQQFYKHRSWWSHDLPDSVHLHPAHTRELANSFRDQLATIYQWLYQWESHERLSLLKDVVKLCNSDVLEALVLYIHQQLRDACDINRLPDKLLLYVLSHLPPKDILNAAQVCRRWRYLCAMDDLWIVKCLEIGEAEGMDNLPQLIQSANTGRMGVDWMLAYMELRGLVHAMHTPASPSLSHSSQHGLTDREHTDISGDKTRGTRPPRKIRIRRSIDVISDVTDTASQGTVATDRASHDHPAPHRGDKRENVGDKGSESSAGMSSEDLSALLGDEAADTLMPELSSKQPGWSKRGQHRSLRSKVQHRIQETVSEKSVSDDNKTDRLSRANGRQKSAGKEEEEEEPALDIHTDLSQSRDLLGKIVPSMSLEWQTPEHEDDFVRYPVYAGKVLTINKVRKVQGHLGSIQCLQFDRRRLITGGVDRTVRLWDIRSGRSVHKFHGHKGGVRCLKFDDDILVTGSWDSVVFVWDIRKFKQAAILHGHDNSVSCLHLVRHFVISGSHDHTVRVWSRTTYMCTLVMSGHSGPVLSLTADDEYVFSTATDLTIRMTDLMTGMCERVFERANMSPLYCMVMHGSLLLGGDSEGRVYFWNTGSGEAEAAVKVHEDAVNTIQYHNGRFYTGSSDGTMTEYDLMTMTCLRVLRGHKGPVRALQVSERRFVSCSDDGTVRIWDLHTNKTTSLSSVF